MNRVGAAAEAVTALLLALLVIVLASVFGSSRSQDADVRASTWVDDRRGAHALHLLLEGAGVPVERSAEPPGAGLPTDRTLVVLAPSWPVTRSETAALLDWTAAGGRLVVVDAPSGLPGAGADLDPLLDALGVESVAAADGDLTTAEGLVPDGLDVRWKPRRAFADAAGATPDARRGEDVALVLRGAARAAVRCAFGDGEVLLVADEDLFVNERLDDGDNAVLAVALLHDPERAAVVFDEFHHGFTPTGTRGGAVRRISALLVDTWVGRALLALGAAGLVLAAGAGVRLGRPLDEPAPRRRALREHADALGRLLDVAHARREALEVLAAGVRRRCGPRAGIAPTLPPAEFRERLARSVAPGASALAEALRDAEAAGASPALKDAEFARVAAKLAAAKRRFVHGGS